jgi:hypothetical protein
MEIQTERGLLRLVVIGGEASEQMDEELAVSWANLRVLWGVYGRRVSISAPRSFALTQSVGVYQHCFAHRTSETGAPVRGSLSIRCSGRV